MRELLLDGLGGEAIHVLEPTAVPFEDAAVTAAITCFRAGRRPQAVRLRRVGDVRRLGALEGGRPVPAERLREARRWSPLTRAARAVPEDHIQLGDLVRVHRGAVTGRNSTWVVRPGETDLPAGGPLPLGHAGARDLRRRLGPVARPATCAWSSTCPRTSATSGPELRRIEGFLARARRDGAHEGYIARARRRWWSVGLRAPAPILATYMARRPPAFTRNLAGARHINIAHGLYPRVELPDDAIDRLLASLRRTVSVHDGRTYAGGLTKFEPREMERLPVPDPFAGGPLTVGARPSSRPPRWSADALDRDIAAAIEAFRLERFEEPLEQYHAHLDECLGTIEELIELTVDLSELRSGRRGRRRGALPRGAAVPRGPLHLG